MRRDITVGAQVRDTRGKNEAHRTRRQGMVPGVVYGAYQDPVAVAVSPKEIQRIVRSDTGFNTIFNLDIEGRENTPVMVVDQQYDPLKGALLHVDFKRIDLSKRIRVSIPVITQGDPQGVKVQGGLLEVVSRAVEVECLPDEITEHFVVDVSGLLIGQNVRAGDIPMPGSMKLVSSPETVIAHVIALRGEAAPAAEAAAPAATAEPEVVKKGKKEEEPEEKPKKK